MITYILLAVAAVATVWALVRLRKDDGAVRRLQRSEYEPLVKHIWWH